LVAEANGEVVGLVAGSPAREYFYSHLLIVRRDMWNKGIGTALKLEQRRRLVEMEWGKAVWVYDPRKPKLNHFNLNKLKTIGVEFLDNYYGFSGISTNEGKETHRLKVVWLLKSKYIKEGDKMCWERRTRSLRELRGLVRSGYKVVGFRDGHWLLSNQPLEELFWGSCAQRTQKNS
jgi:hypothetical protein